MSHTTSTTAGAAMTTTMRAYNGDHKLRRAFIAQIKLHRKQAQIVKGIYGKENGQWRGCAVGCSIHSLNAIQGTTYRTDDHAIAEKIGIPQSLYRLQDQIFESLPVEDGPAFVEAFATAIPCNADLSKVTAQFLVWCLLDKKHGAIRQAPADKFKDCHDAILAAAAVWTDYIKTGVINESASWSASESARSTAWSASWSASESARSAAWSARSAAESASWSARSAAESASWSARSAAESTAWSAAASAFWKAAAATLVKLLGAAKVEAGDA